MLVELIRRAMLSHLGSIPALRHRSPVAVRVFPNYPRHSTDVAAFGAHWTARHAQVHQAREQQDFSALRELRYQAGRYANLCELLNWMHDRRADDRRGVLLVAPTGSGKTTACLDVCRNWLDQEDTNVFLEADAPTKVPIPVWISSAIVSQAEDSSPVDAMLCHQIVDWAERFSTTEPLTVELEALLDSDPPLFVFLNFDSVPRAWQAAVASSISDFQRRNGARGHRVVLLTASLPRDPAILRTLAGHNDPAFGVYSLCTWSTAECLSWIRAAHTPGASPGHPSGASVEGSSLDELCGHYSALIEAHTFRDFYTLESLLRRPALVSLYAALPFEHALGIRGPSDLLDLAAPLESPPSNSPSDFHVATLSQIQSDSSLLIQESIRPSAGRSMDQVPESVDSALPDAWSSRFAAFCDAHAADPETAAMLLGAAAARADRLITAADGAPHDPLAHRLLRAMLLMRRAGAAGFALSFVRGVGRDAVLGEVENALLGHSDQAERQYPVQMAYNFLHSTGRAQSVCREFAARLLNEHRQAAPGRSWFRVVTAPRPFVVRKTQLLVDESFEGPNWTADTRIVQDGRKGTITAWDPLHADLSVHVFGDSIGRIAAGPDGIVAIAASESRPLSSLDLDSGRRIEFPHGRYGNPLVALSQGRFVIQDVAGDFGVFVWTPGKSNVVRLEQISERWMENRCYDFGPNESLAYAVSLIDPKTCQSWPAIVNWDIRTGRKALVEFGREHYIDSLKCLADGTVIYNDSIQVGAWDPKSGRLRASPAGKWNSQSPFIVVGENQVLYVTRAGSASRDPGLCLWDPRSETTKLFGPDWVQIRPLGGDRVAISEPQLDHTSVWRITDKESHREGMLPVGAREFHPAPDGGVLYLSSQQTQEVMNSRLQPGSKQIELRIHLAYADSDRQRDAHLANWRELAPWDLRFTPDGRVYGGRDANRLYVLNPETGAVSSIPILPVTGGIARVDWLADGWLALWASDSDVVFNHPETGRRVPLRFGSTDHTAPADWLVRIDNENQQFAVSVWSPRTGRTAVMNDDRHLAKITSAQVFSDGWVISCSEDLNVKAWNLELGEVRTLMDCDAVPFAAEYPGSRALVSSKDGVVRLWDYREDSAQVLIAGHGIPGALALGDGRIVMPDKVGLSLFSPQGTKLCELPVEAIRFACVPTGNRIATASQIGVAVYEVE